MRLELTRRGDYAVRAMLALARHPTSDPLSSRRIAEEMEIPPRFLVQVLGELARQGLVEATTGRHGGYRLARPAGEVSLLAVIEAVEENATVNGRCVLRGGPCRPDGRCAVHDVFSAAQSGFRATLAAASLADVAAFELVPSATRKGRPGQGRRTSR